MFRLAAVDVDPNGHAACGSGHEGLDHRSVRQDVGRQVYGPLRLTERLNVDPFEVLAGCVVNFGRMSRPAGDGEGCEGEVGEHGGRIREVSEGCDPTLDERHRPGHLRPCAASTPPSCCSLRPSLSRRAQRRRSLAVRSKSTRRVGSRPTASWSRTAYGS